MADETWTLVALKEHLERLLIDLQDSTDRRFVDSQRDVEKALAAVKSETKLSLDAAEKAITKAEAKQDAYNASHNDLIRKAEKLAELTMPRQEIESRVGSAREHVDEVVKGLYDRVVTVERIINRGEGGIDSVERARQQTYRIIGGLVAAASVVIALIRLMWKG